MSFFRGGSGVLEDGAACKSFYKANRVVWHPCCIASLSYFISQGYEKIRRGGLYFLQFLFVLGAFNKATRKHFFLSLFPFLLGLLFARRCAFAWRCLQIFYKAKPVLCGILIAWLLALVFQQGRVTPWVNDAARDLYFGADAARLLQRSGATAAVASSIPYRGKRHRCDFG